jgi:hypothetical protein
VSFGDVQNRVFRVIGSELRSTTGIFGGIQNAQDGLLHIDHEDFPPEPPLQVHRGAFWGMRQWASVPNRKTGGTDSRPGRISIRFVQRNGVEFRAQRNIDWGSWWGNQAFLLDTKEMLVDSSGAVARINTSTANEFVVHQNYPNPFNPTTEIQYVLSHPAEVEIKIFNILGHSVKTVAFKRQAAGGHKIVWDATDDLGRAVGSGLYFYRVKAGQNWAMKKMLLLR